MDTGINTITELKSILKVSEAHALTCTLERGLSTHLFNRRIAKGYLSISVSEKKVKEAIRVFNIFLRRMFKEGFFLTLECDKYHRPASALIVNGETIPIRVKEKYTFSEYRDRFGDRRREATLSGVLMLEIYGGEWWHSTKSLCATNNSSWEDLFNGIIPYLLKASNSIKELRLRYEEQARKRKEWDGDETSS